MNHSEPPTPPTAVVFTVYLDKEIRPKESTLPVVEETKFERFRLNAENLAQTKPEIVINGVSVNGMFPARPILGFVFVRRRGVPSLLILLLRGFAQRVNATSLVLGGPRRSAAATMYDAVTPHVADEPSWLMKMFLPEAHENRRGTRFMNSLSAQLGAEFFDVDWYRNKSFYTARLRPSWQWNVANQHPFMLHLVENIDKPVHPSAYEIIAAMVGTRKYIEEFFASKMLGVGVRISRVPQIHDCLERIRAYIANLAARAGNKWINPDIVKLIGQAKEIPGNGDKMVCVPLPSELGTALFRVALWLPMPSHEEDVITLVALDREGGAEQLLLRISDASPPESPASPVNVFNKLSEIGDLAKDIPPEALDEELVREIERLHGKLRGLSGSDKGKIQEGSTVLSVLLSPVRSRLLEQALSEGQIEIPEEITFEWHPSTNVPKAGWSNLDVTAPANDLRSFLRKAYRYEYLVRPWRRLYSILWPTPQSSPSASVLADSADRAYSLDGFKTWWRSLIVDIKIGLFVWPFLTCLLIVVSCLFAGLFGLPTNLVWGIATGLVLCLLGAQPCSSVVSPLGCHAGAVFVGWAFGFAQALLMGNNYVAQQINAENMLKTPFKTITGGLVGLSAPHWRPLAKGETGLSIPTVVIILLCTAAGIGMSGWLMGQARKAKGPPKSRGPLPDWAGGLVGFLAGALIPVVKLLAAGLTAVFHLDGPTSFSCAFAIIGGSTMACVVDWKTRQGSGNHLRGIASGIVHAIIAFGLIQFAFWAAQNSNTLTASCAICAACGFFHATWFTAAYVIGEKLSTTRGAVYATLLEGIPFYLAFLITEMLHIPMFG